MFAPKRDDYREAVLKLHNENKFHSILAIQVDSVEPGHVEVSMPIDGQFTQHHGYVHAGIITSVADMASGLAAYSLMSEGEEILSININMSLMRPGKGKLIKATGRVVKPGNKVYFGEAEVFASDGNNDELIARASITHVAGKRS